MVSLQDSQSASSPSSSSRRLHSIYSSKLRRDTSSSSTSAAHSMRTIRSSFSTLSIPNTDPTTGPTTTVDADDDDYDDPTNTNTENLSDSLVDIHLNHLASRTPNSVKRDNFFHHLSLSSVSNVSDFSFSSSSSVSDISGELHRLATSLNSPISNNNSNSESEGQGPQVEPPCLGFLQRENFSTEFLDNISPEDLQPTVKLCIDGLKSDSVQIKRSAAAKLRMLAKNRPENRLLIADSGAIPHLVSLLRFSSDPSTQEHAVTALLNLSLHPDNKMIITTTTTGGGGGGCGGGGGGAIKSLVYVLKTGTEVSKQNAAAALMSLAIVNDDNRLSIGACGAIPPLVSLLRTGSSRGKKDALTTLYKLCSVKMNKERAVAAGAVRPLVELVTEEKGMAEKAMVVLSSLAGIEEGRREIVEEGGIVALVEAVEEGSEKGKEFAVLTLLQLCVESVGNRGLLVREGGIPPLVALSQNGTPRAKQKAETLLGYLREPRQGASTSTP